MQRIQDFIHTLFIAVVSWAERLTLESLSLEDTPLLRWLTLHGLVPLPWLWLPLEWAVDLQAASCSRHRMQSCLRALPIKSAPVNGWRLTHSVFPLKQLSPKAAQRGLRYIVAGTAGTETDKCRATVTWGHRGQAEAQAPDQDTSRIAVSTNNTAERPLGLRPWRLHF